MGIDLGLSDEDMGDLRMREISVAVESKLQEFKDVTLAAMALPMPIRATLSHQFLESINELPDMFMKAVLMMAVAELVKAEIHIEAHHSNGGKCDVPCTCDGPHVGL